MRRILLHITLLAFLLLAAGAVQAVHWQGNLHADHSNCQICFTLGQPGLAPVAVVAPAPHPTAPARVALLARVAPHLAPRREPQGPRAPPSSDA